MKKYLKSMFFCLLAVPAFGDVVFPEAKDVPENLKMPPGAKLTVDSDGNVLVNGKIRFLIAVKMVSGSPYKDLQPRPGYPASLKWLYERPMHRDAMHRLGFDLISVNGNPAPWLVEIDPKRKFDWSGSSCITGPGFPCIWMLADLLPGSPVWRGFPLTERSCLRRRSIRSRADTGRTGFPIPYFIRQDALFI